MTQHEHERAEPVEVRALADLGSTIRSLRKEQGLTQSDLASWLGTERKTIARLEAGHSVALNLALDAIAILGYTVVLRPRGARGPS